MTDLPEALIRLVFNTIKILFNLHILYTFKCMCVLTLTTLFQILNSNSFEVFRDGHASDYCPAV